MPLRLFPENFKWSVGTSAYQIEGAWNIDGKGPSIWDTFCRKDPSPIVDKSTGDVACDSYSNLERDVQMVKELNVKFYRFSFSWPRILPKGTIDCVNSKGVDYYRKLIDLLLENGIQPMVTLFHWDLPQSLGDRGGWINRQCVQWFAEYAKFCFETFGDKVKYWFTINEPKIFTIFGYGQGTFAPGITGQSEWSAYLVFHHLLLAHANAFRIYDKQFRTKQKGQISIVLDAARFKPLNSDSEQDKKAADRCQQFSVGIFAHPIFSSQGDYPQVVKELIEQKSLEEGRATSRLPKFSQEEIQMLKGSADFMALNHYATLLVSEPQSGAPKSPFQPVSHDMNVSLSRDKTTFCYANSHVHHNPASLRAVLNFIRTEYNNPRVFITENGCPTLPEVGLNDTDRIKFFNDYLASLLDAIDDGCKVECYSAWSLMDNFEWSSGYQMRFGLYEVDFEDPKRKRTPKDSAKFYADVATNNGIDDTIEYSHSKC